MTGVQPADDLAIVDDTVLWRRIRPDWYVLDENTGRRRVTSKAFQNMPGTDNMSVCIADECQGHDDFLQGLADYGIAELTAGHCRLCTQIIVRARGAAEHPAHCHVVGNKNNKKKRCLRDAATMVVDPAIG